MIDMTFAQAALHHYADRYRTARAEAEISIDDDYEGDPLFAAKHEPSDEIKQAREQHVKDALGADYDVCKAALTYAQLIEWKSYDTKNAPRF